jgi:hypothetical protein
LRGIDHSHLRRFDAVVLASTVAPGGERESDEAKAEHYA